jgi:hypothetical protein
MMSPEEIFHRHVRDKGGSLDLSLLPSQIGRGLDYVAKRARGFLLSARQANPHIPNIHFDFIDNHSLNAFATKLVDNYFIGINRGTVAILSFVFNRLLADRSVLPFLGNIELEEKQLPFIPSLGPDFAESVCEVDPFPPPRDPSRRALATRFTEISLDFILAHEFAHIANGHLDFMQRTHGMEQVEEVSTQSLGDSKEKGAIHRKTLEMNADEVATVFTLINEWKRCLGQFSRRGPEWNDIYDRPGMVTMLWSYAIAVLCRIFGDARLQRNPLGSSVYPTWRLRSVMIQRISGKINRPSEWVSAQIMHNEGVDHSMPLVALATFKNVETDFAAVMGKKISTAGLDDAWSDLGQSEIEEMQFTWTNELHPLLEPLAFQSLDIVSMSFFE